MVSLPAILCGYQASLIHCQVARYTFLVRSHSSTTCYEIQWSGRRKVTLCWRSFYSELVCCTPQCLMISYKADSGMIENAFSHVEQLAPPDRADLTTFIHQSSQISSYATKFLTTKQSTPAGTLTLRGAGDQLLSLSPESQANEPK